MKYSTLVSSALVALTVFTGIPARAADNMASIGITPATGVVTLLPHWAIGGNLAGFHQMSQNLGLTGSVANNFYSIRAGTIPAGGDILAFNFYVPGSGSATPHSDIGSKLTPDSYSALTSADPDVGYGSVNLYLIHHKGTTDYFTAIVPGSATSSAVTDEKPMSGPGGPGTVTGVSGYFGLTFAAGNLGYGLNSFYYLRTDPVSGITKFGTLAPALLAGSADQFDLGTSGHKALAFTGADVGYGVNKMYYLRLDPVTGFTIFGMLDPALAGARHTSDIANLGSVYSTLTFVPGDVGYGSSQFYTTGTVNTTWQSVSFAAIADQAISSGSFAINPTASSALPIVVTVVAGSTGAATISTPVGGVFTVTPTQPGIVTLQATQVGAVNPIPYESNMLRQSFTVTGIGYPVVTNSPLTKAGTVGTAFNFSITASNSPTVYTASPLPAGLVFNGATGAITGTPTTVGVTSVLLGATNASGTGNATLTVTVAAAGVAPIITNSPLTAAGTIGTVFSFSITASGTPTTYTASPLPAGLSIAAATGVITGIPTTVGVTSVLLGATNGTGTGNATLTITVAAAGVAPIITNSPLTAAGTIGTAFSFSITASGSPASYTASPLPAGLTVVAATGVITGTPTTAGVTSTVLSATNGTGTGSATLTITVAAAGVAPIITNSPLTAAGTVGTAFSFSITASGSPASYTASPLPAGLSVVALTGVITGTPTTAGVTSVLLGATNGTGTGTATLTVTVAAAGVAPNITSPTTAPGTVGTAFVTYQIIATGLPTSFSASGLPAGLTINTLTGAINGTPTTAGVSAATLGATNSTGTATATLTITVAAAGVAPVITSATTAPGTVGTTFATYQIAATGLPTSFSATGLPAGLTVNTLTGAINGTPTAAGTSAATIKATNGTGTGTATLTITVAAAGLPPVIIVPVLTSAASASGTVGAPFVTYQITATDNPTSYAASNLPPGLVINTLTGRITGTPVSTGSYHVSLSVIGADGIGSNSLLIAIAPGISVPPASATVASGAGATFSVTANTGGNSVTYQWQKDGVNIPGATGASLTVANVQAANIGSYRVVVSSWDTSTTSVAAVLGMTFTGQIAGTAVLAGANIQHPNGNFYDQVQLTGVAASTKAVSGRVVRVSFVDLTDDIVQVEMSGAGVLTINLEGSSGPASPVKYNQPGVLYMKGQASIAITGADATTNVSIFSVGRSNAVDQTLFIPGVTYDGYADIALVTVASADGSFGGLRTANASYFRANGTTGIYAPGVRFNGPVFVSDIDGANTANADLILGSVTDARVTGGDLFQDNGGAVEVSGMTRLQFTAGTSSGGMLLPAQANRGVLMTNGAVVTSQLVP